MSNTPDSFQDTLKKALKKPNVTKALKSEIGAGKLPPQAVELEEAVLGALMLEKEAIQEVIDALVPECFYREEHQEIYSACLSLFERSIPIDILTLTDELRKAGKLEMIGGPYYLSELTHRVGSAANIEFHARIIQEKHILRELIKISSNIQNKAFDPQTDVFQLLDDAEQDLFGISEGNLKSHYQAMSSLITEAITQIEELKNQEEGLTGIGTGFVNLDRITSGWQRSDLIILAARPGMGKTSFVLSIARNAAVEFKKPVAVFSLEMSSVQLVNRLISGDAEIDSHKLRHGNLEDYEWQQLHAKIGRLSEAPIFIDDTPGLNVFDLRAKARRLKSKHNIELLIIDYLQLMSGSSDKNGGNREQEISQISRALKGLAKDLNIPVIALSQLSRAVETRGGTKKPQLSDLRESGSIEQDADQVMFIYRPEYYGFDTDEDGNPCQGVAELIIAKNRHGAADTVRLRFINKFAKFADLDDFEQPGSGFLTDAEGIIRKSSSMNEEDQGAPF